MRYFYQYLYGLLFGLFGIYRVAFANLIVIAHPNFPVDHLTTQQVIEIYKGNEITLGALHVEKPYDQEPNSFVYQNFYQNLFHESPSQINAYWSDQFALHGNTRPEWVKGDAQAIATVASVPGALAYVESNSLKITGGKVKVVYGDMPGAKPGQRYFPGVNHKASLMELPLPESMFAQGISNTKIAPLGSAPIQFSQKDVPDIWADLVSHFNLHANQMENNKAVQKQIDWYLSHRFILNMLLNNAKPYLAYVFEQTKIRQMPAEFALLPMVESGYNPLAYSYAGASGLWQMMPGTASGFGLSVNWWYDGRADIVSSTKAGLDFLSGIYSALNDWYLTAAAYNAGQTTITNALAYNQKAGLSTDFWNLPLPIQTREYVPKLLALAIIIANPGEYHVQLPYIPNTPFFTAVTIQSQMTLPEIADFSNTSILMIHHLNPGLQRFATNPDMPCRLLIPSDKLAIFQSNLARMAQKTHLSWEYHEVRAEEDLAKIAHNYHTNLGLLARVNGLSSLTVHTGESVLVPLRLNRTFPSLTKENSLAPPIHLAPLVVATLPASLAPPLPTQKFLAATPLAPISKNDSLKTEIDKIYHTDS